MKNMSHKQWVLIVSAPFLCISMLLLIPYLTAKTGKTAGYVTGFCIYWFLFCLPVSAYCSGGFTRLKEIYRQKSNITSRMKTIYYFLALIPCIATFFAVFKNIAPIAGFQVLILALLFGMINGTLEEMFWRGIFNKIFNDHMIWAYLYPSLFFGMWHIALYLAKGMVYQGGGGSLVGGSLFMGLLWGLAAYKTKSVKLVTAAHIITNFFSFTGLIYQNWFM